MTSPTHAALVERLKAAGPMIVKRGLKSAYVEIDEADYHAILAALSTPPLQPATRTWQQEPPDDLKVAGEAMTLAECDDMLDCIAQILNEHMLNGETHSEMMRWKFRTFVPATLALQGVPG